MRFKHSLQYKVAKSQGEILVQPKLSGRIHRIQDVCRLSNNMSSRSQGTSFSSLSQAGRLFKSLVYNKLLRTFVKCDNIMNLRETKKFVYVIIFFIQ